MLDVDCMNFINRQSAISIFVSSTKCLNHAVTLLAISHPMLQNVTKELWVKNRRLYPDAAVCYFLLKDLGEFKIQDKLSIRHKY
jgi:hypothetical protein